MSANSAVNTGRNAFVGNAATEDNQGYPTKRRATVYRKKSIEQYDLYFHSIEEVMAKVGTFGMYQILSCLLTFFSVIPWYANYVQIFYAMMENSFTCVDPYDNSTIYSGTDRTYFCQVLDKCTNLTVSEKHLASMVTEWRLTCDRKVLVYVVLVSFLIGRIMGALTGGHLSDNFGRLCGLFLMHSFGLVVRALSIASRDWKALAVFQFIIGAIFGQIQTACMTLLIESTDGVYRFLPIACSQLSAAYLVFALISFAVNDWRMYLIIISLISSPLLYGYILFQESSRWLLTKNKTAQAADVITELCADRWKGDGEEVRPMQLNTIVLDQEGKKMYTLLDLFRTRHLTLSTAILLLSTISMSFINGSLIFFGNQSIINDIALHMALSGLLRLTFLVIGIFLSMKIARLGCRHLLLSSLSVIVLCFAAVTVMFFMHQTEEFVKVTYGLLILAASLNGSIYHMSILHTIAVTYPTVVRSIAFGFFIAFEDLGTIIIGALIEEITRVWSVVPCIAIEIVLIVTLIASIWYIPETKYSITKHLLPNTFSDLD